jgi:hypothetical protein
VGIWPGFGAGDGVTSPNRAQVHPPKHQFLRTHPWVIAGRARGFIGGAFNHAFNGQPWHDLWEQMPSSDPNALGSATSMDPNVLGHWGICPYALGSHDPNGPPCSALGSLGSAPQCIGVDLPQNALGSTPNRWGMMRGQPRKPACVGWSFLKMSFGVVAWPLVDSPRREMSITVTKFKTSCCEYG